MDEHAELEVAAVVDRLALQFAWLGLYVYTQAALGGKQEAMLQQESLLHRLDTKGMP